jgi:GTPase SAR1 family protein
MSSSSNSTASKKYFKIVLLGNSGVGKTALIERFFHNKFENKENVIHFSNNIANYWN